MIAALPAHTSSLTAATSPSSLVQAPDAPSPNDLHQANDASLQQAHAAAAQQISPSSNVDAFYTVGCNQLHHGVAPCSREHSFQPSTWNKNDPYHFPGESAEALPSQGAEVHQEHDENFNYTNSSHLFTDPLSSLPKKGGLTDPLAMFKLQAEVIETTLNWSLYGQMASKAVSGIQSLFNNQV